MNPTNAGSWMGDWAWSLPLIVLTLVFHVEGLALIGERVVGVMGESVSRRRLLAKFALVLGATSLLATLLHGIEGGFGPLPTGFWVPCQTTGPLCSTRSAR